MRGPIDYIIVGFEGNKFDGSILNALANAIDRGVISLVALAVISKDREGNVTELDAVQDGNTQIIEFTAKYAKKAERVKYEDVHEVAEVLDNDTTAGLLIIEQLWAKPLKKALLDARGVLIAEGRIHPEASRELDKKGDR